MLRFAQQSNTYKASHGTTIINQAPQAKRPQAVGNLLPLNNES